MDLKVFDIFFMMVLYLPKCWKGMKDIREAKIESMSALDAIKLAITTWGFIANIFIFPLFYMILIKNDGIISTLDMLWEIRSYKMADIINILSFENITTFMLDYFGIFMKSTIILLVCMYISLAALEILCPIETSENGEDLGNR